MRLSCLVQASVKKCGLTWTGTARLRTKKDRFMCLVHHKAGYSYSLHCYKKDTARRCNSRRLLVTNDLTSMSVAMLIRFGLVVPCRSGVTSFSRQVIDSLQFLSPNYQLKELESLMNVISFK